MRSQIELYSKMWCKMNFKSNLSVAIFVSLPHTELPPSLAAAAARFHSLLAFILSTMRTTNADAAMLSLEGNVSSKTKIEMLGNRYKMPISCTLLTTSGDGGMRRKRKMKINIYRKTASSPAWHGSVMRKKWRKCFRFSSRDNSEISWPMMFMGNSIALPILCKLQE